MLSTIPEGGKGLTFAKALRGVLGSFSLFLTRQTAHNDALRVTYNNHRFYF